MPAAAMREDVFPIDITGAANLIRRSVPLFARHFRPSRVNFTVSHNIKVGSTRRDRSVGGRIRRTGPIAAAFQGEI